MEKKQREMEIFQQSKKIYMSEHFGDVIYNTINCAWIVLGERKKEKNPNQLNNSGYVFYMG